jgi:fumarate reductase subunit D
MVGVGMASHPSRRVTAMFRDPAVQLVIFVIFAVWLGRVWMRLERALQDIKGTKAGLENRRRQAWRAATTLGIGLTVVYLIVKIYMVGNGG